MERLGYFILYWIFSNHVLLDKKVKDLSCFVHVDLYKGPCFGQPQRSILFVFVHEYSFEVNVGIGHQPSDGTKLQNDETNTLGVFYGGGWKDGEGMMWLMS